MAGRRRERGGAATQVAAEVIINFGSSVAGLLIPVVGVVSVVTARQVVLLATLGPFYRPSRETLRLRRLWPALALGLALVAMNLSFYEAVGRLGLGIAAVIEFLGPFALAVAGSRRVVDVFCAIGAACGVVLLTQGAERVDGWGVACALAAAAAWAAYILLTRQAALRLPGLEGATVASIVSTAILLPVALVVVDYGALRPRVLLLLLALGLLSSTLPYSLDTFILRRIDPRVYAVLTSVGPAIAAVFGWLVLHESFDGRQQVGIALVCACAIVSVLAPSRRSRAREDARTG